MLDGGREDARTAMLREVRQRLESLRRAGVNKLPLPSPTARIAFSARSSEPRSVAVDRGVIPPNSRAAVADVSPFQAPLPKPTPAISSLFEETAITTAPVEPGERAAQLAILAKEVAACARCPHLAETRTQTVFGTGTPTARLMFVGEAPGADEDRTGLPFVGAAGQLLTDMITKGMGLTRDEVYIANILKSRPPGNRNPLADEIKNCLPFLEQQIAIIRPEFICMLGKVAASSLLVTSLPVGKLRGKWHRYRGIASIVTYHPSYLLREPSAKKSAWEDLQMLMQAMGLKVPSRKKS